MSVVDAVPPEGQTVTEIVTRVMVWYEERLTAATPSTTAAGGGQTDEVVPSIRIKL